MFHHLWIAPLIALAPHSDRRHRHVRLLAPGARAPRALRLHPVTDVCCRVVLWLTTGQSRREWVAVHRKHHTFTDRVGDPHSPRLFGFWHIQFWNVTTTRGKRAIPRRSGCSRRTSRRTGWIARSSPGAWLGSRWELPSCAWCLACGSAWLPGWRTPSCTSSCWRCSSTGSGTGGAKNFDNTAYNSRALAWLTGGESLHNNHHAHPRTAKFSMRRSEFDPSWVVIRILAAIKLGGDRGRAGAGPPASATTV